METLLRILILEDMPEDVGLIKRVLNKDGVRFEAMQVDTRTEFIEALGHFGPDVILSDHALPQFDSIQALKLSRETGHQIPFILVTGAVSEEFAVNCLKQGADDYVLKSNLSRLPSAIRNSIHRHYLQNEKRKAEDSLVQQNVELMKINSELDTFVYNVSHNLRSPLASLLGLIHLVKKENDGSRLLTPYFTMMENSVHKLDATLREILQYSQNNRNEINRVPIDFDELIKNCFDELQYLPGSGEIDTTASVQGNQAFFSDPHRLAVLMHNLVSNSAHYRDLTKRKPIIRIGVNISADQVQIEFEDNGIGIAESQLPFVFDMFYRANERSEGAGLGLYITKEIVHMLKGDISIHSKLHEGTTVTVVIPNLAENS